MCENTYIGVWSFSGISSRIQPLAHMPCCSSWSFYLKQLKLPVLNEMHTNSCTGPRLCAILRKLRHTRTDDDQLMAWSNLANLFFESLHNFCQLYYNIKQIDFIFLGFCTVIDHRWRHDAWRTKSHGSRLRLVHTFLIFTRHDVICDLLQYRRT